MDTPAGETRQRRPFVSRDERQVLYASSNQDGVATLGVFSPDDGRRVHLPVEGVHG